MSGKKKAMDAHDDGIEDKVEEILDFMNLIKKNLIGERFESIPAKLYNIETFNYEKCPECGKMHQKFFLLLQPGDDLFDTSKPETSIKNYRIFCLECSIIYEKQASKKNDKS
ncbi:MAG: hypothetical protein ACTSWN_15915 [Promethearchaeota archaeon]